MQLIKSILRLHKNAVKLKKLKRTGWAKRGVPEPESVAAHSFAVALLALFLADLRGLDPSDVLRMALIHDLPEALTGDLTPRMKKEFKGLEQLERRFIEDLAKELPKPIASKYLDAWNRYQNASDPAARLVRDLDKLEMGLQAVEYVREGWENAVEIYESALRRIEDEELRNALEAAWEA